MNPHLRNLTLPFVVVIAVILWWTGISLNWWQVILLLGGMALWDIGWHANVHHRGTLIASIWVRILGALLALLGTLTPLFLS